MKHHTLQEAASVSLSLLDLTNLNDDCTDKDIETLLERAHTPYGTPAAICGLRASKVMFMIGVGLRPPGV